MQPVRRPRPTLAPRRCQPGRSIRCRHRLQDDRGGLPSLPEQSREGRGRAPGSSGSNTPHTWRCPRPGTRGAVQGVGRAGSWPAGTTSSTLTRRPSRRPTCRRRNPGRQQSNHRFLCVEGRLAEAKPACAGCLTGSAQPVHARHVGTHCGPDGVPVGETLTQLSRPAVDHDCACALPSNHPLNRLRLPRRRWRMRKVQVVLQDDIDGSEPAQTVHFALGRHGLRDRPQRRTRRRTARLPGTLDSRRSPSRSQRIPAPRSKSQERPGRPPPSGTGPRRTASRSPPTGASPSICAPGTRPPTDTANVAVGLGTAPANRTPGPTGARGQPSHHRSRRDWRGRLPRH